MQQNPLQQHRPLSTATLQHPGQIRNTAHLTHFLHANKGSHVPVWLHKNLAAQIIAQHAPSGMAIPHPGVPIPMPDPAQQQPQPPQAYAQGGMVGADPQDLELAPGVTPQTLPGATAGGMSDQGMPNEMGDWVNRNRFPASPPADAPYTPEQTANVQAAINARGGGMGAIHPPPSFGGGPTLAPQQIDQGGVGISNTNSPQGLGGLNIGSRPQPQGLNGLSIPPQPVDDGSGGANLGNAVGPFAARPDNRRMKKGGVVKKYAKGGVVDDEDEDDEPKKKVKSKGKK